MNVSDVVNKIMDAWSSDEAIADYCLSAFSRRPMFQDAIDENQPPGEDDFPMICIYDWHSEGGLTTPMIRYQFFVGIAVRDKGITMDDIRRVKSYDGLHRAEFLRGLVERSLLSARIGKVVWEGGGEVINSFPTFASISVVTVEVHNKRTRE